MSFSTDIALWVRAARAARGLTQRDLAARSTIDQSHISRIEKGLDARISTLSAVVNAMGGELMVIPSDLAPTVRALLNERYSQASPFAEREKQSAVDAIAGFADADDEEDEDVTHQSGFQP